MNIYKILTGVFLFIFLVFITPEMETAITTISGANPLLPIFQALPMALDVTGLAVPVYLGVKED